MSVTTDTSQSPIGPCGPLAQSKTRDIFTHATATAASNSDLLRGLNTAVEATHMV